MKLRPEVLLALFAVGVFAYAIFEARTFPATTRPFPFIIAGVGLVLASLLTVQEVKRPKRGVAKQATESVDSDDDSSARGAYHKRRAIRVAEWIAGLYLGTWILGFTIALPLWFLLFLRLDGRFGWPKSLLITAFASYLFLFQLEQAFHLFWPEGLLGQWIRW